LGGGNNEGESHRQGLAVCVSGIGGYLTEGKEGEIGQKTLGEEEKLFKERGGAEREKNRREIQGGEIVR